MEQVTITAVSVNKAGKDPRYEVQKCGGDKWTRKMRMREVEAQYPNLISRYYGQNKDVTVGLNSFNNFIAEQEKIRERNKPRIEGAMKMEMKKFQRTMGMPKLRKTMRAMREMERPPSLSQQSASIKWEKTLAMRLMVK